MSPDAVSVSGLFTDQCCRVAHFNESGCKVQLPRPPAVSLSGSSLQMLHNIAGKLCDLLVCHPRAEGNDVVVVEAKSGSANASHVREQLQGGADLVQRTSTGLPVAKFRAVLASRRMNTVELRQFAKQKIRFRGKAYPIHRIKCRDSAISKNDQ